jgi:cytochrome oxidase Cu insertion factor (SCO1/SenC/PrrC family)
MQGTFGSGKPSWSGFLVFSAIATLPVALMGSVKLLKAPQPLPVLGEVGQFTLTERSGATVTHQELRDYIWIADFIFTSCAGPCPMMTAQMADLQEALFNETKVKLVSISVDPDRDTPEVLTDYASKFEADTHRWWFLTGDIAQITTLAVERFKLGSVENPIFHSTKFVLVDGQGRIRGYYDSETDDYASQLIADVHRLQAEARR